MVLLRKGGKTRWVTNGDKHPHIYTVEARCKPLQVPVTQSFCYVSAGEQIWTFISWSENWSLKLNYSHITRFLAHLRHNRHNIFGNAQISKVSPIRKRLAVRCRQSPPCSPSFPSRKCKAKKPNNPTRRNRPLCRVSIRAG